jgi:hypothetical protein
MTSVNPLLGDKYKYDEQTGRFVNQLHKRVASVINNYDPELYLVWIEPADREEGDGRPYAIIHQHPDGSCQFLSYWREDQVDERLLEWCFENDFRKHRPNDIFDRMMAKNDAIKLLEEERIQEAHDERMDVVVSMMKSHLHTYKHGKRKYRS